MRTRDLDFREESPEQKSRMYDHLCYAREIFSRRRRYREVRLVEEEMTILLDNTRSYGLLN